MDPPNSQGSPSTLLCDSRGSENSEDPPSHPILNAHKLDSESAPKHPLVQSETPDVQEMATTPDDTVPSSMDVELQQDDLNDIGPESVPPSTQTLIKTTLPVVIQDPLKPVVLSKSAGFTSQTTYADILGVAGATQEPKSTLESPTFVKKSIPLLGSSPDCGITLERLKNTLIDNYVEALEHVTGKKTVIFIGQSPEDPKYVTAFLASPELVKRVVSQGVRVRGSWLCVTHYQQPATKVVVSGVMPFISDQKIIEACRPYGTTVYPQLRRIPASVRADHLTGVLSFRRELLLVLIKDKVLPDNITVFANGSIHNLSLSTEGVTCFRCAKKGHLANNCKTELPIKLQPNSKRISDTGIKHSIDAVQFIKGPSNYNSSDCAVKSHHDATLHSKPVVQNSDVDAWRTASKIKRNLSTTDKIAINVKSNTINNLKTNGAVHGAIQTNPDTSIAALFNMKTPVQCHDDANEGSDDLSDQCLIVSPGGTKKIKKRKKRSASARVNKIKLVDETEDSVKKKNLLSFAAAPPKSISIQSKEMSSGTLKGSPDAVEQGCKVSKDNEKPSSKKEAHSMPQNKLDTNHCLEVANSLVTSLSNLRGTKRTKVLGEFLDEHPVLLQIVNKAQLLRSAHKPGDALSKTYNRIKDEIKILRGQRAKMKESKD